MQFFPDIASNGVSALGGVGLSSGSSGSAPGKVNAFLESLNGELAASGITPIVDVSVDPGLPRGFRMIKQDVSASLDTEDVSLIVDKLRQRGVKDSALTGIEGLLGSGVSPTIGNIMGAARNKGRATAELTEDEYQMLATVFQKLQLTPEESDELMEFVESGRGFEAMRMLKDKAAKLGEGALTLNPEEARVLARALDLSNTALTKIAGLFKDDEDTKSLEELLSPITEELSTRKSEAEKLAAEIKSVIDEALREKKIREKNELVADTRGTQLTDRAERRMRDDLTAKANGFGKTDAELRKELEEDEAFADEQAARDQQQELARHRSAGERKTVSAMDTATDRPFAGAEKNSSQAQKDFSPILSRMDATPGMTVPGQNLANATQQNTAATLTQRQDIYAQVEQGMLRQLADGSRRMTLQLNPSELGQLTLVLSVKGGEVRALIRADNPEAAAALSDQMGQLRAALEEQGLKVAQLDVETQLPQDTTKEQWSDMTQFSKEQEMREQQRFQRLAKIRRESGTTLAQDMQSKGMQEEISASGLHVIA